MTTSKITYQILITHIFYRATAVELVNKGQTLKIAANKEIILSAGFFSSVFVFSYSIGSINTCQILMLSGIGPEEELKKHNIEVIQNLPVGENLQDHIFVGEIFECDRPITLQESLVKVKKFRGIF